MIGRNARFLAGSALEQPALEVIRNALREHRAAQAVVPVSYTHLPLHERSARAGPPRF